MENGHLHDDKLFRAVHDRLSDYEAPANGADWDAMSRALDNLPKTSRYQWKFSLNSVLWIVGFVGVSALSFALVSKTGKSPDKKAEQVMMTTPQTNPNTVVPVNNAQQQNPSQNSFTDANTYAYTNVSSTDVAANNQLTSAQQQQSVSSNGLTTDAPKTKRRKNELRFGDQIDPKKGFIYNTQEKPNVITTAVADPEPNVFYDTENGLTRKIIMKSDSVHKGSSRNKADSTAKLSTPGVPTEGGTTGFDME
jgi:hypothetical protein